MKLLITLTCLLFAHCLSSAAAEEPESTIYAKFIMKIEPTAEEDHPKVEPWIAERLKKTGETKLRAVTKWIRIQDDDAHLWTPAVDGKAFGCPTCASVDRSKPGVVAIDLSGWSPGGLPGLYSLQDYSDRVHEDPDADFPDPFEMNSAVGSRDIAVIPDEPDRTTFVAFLAGPPLAVQDPLSSLLMNSKKIELKSEWGHTPLHFAAAASRERSRATRNLISRMIQAGEDVRASTSSGATALHEAVAAGSADLVEDLIKAGADVSALVEIHHEADPDKAWDGMTALDIAVQNQQEPIAALLREHGARPGGEVAKIADEIRAGRIQEVKDWINSGGAISPIFLPAAAEFGTPEMIELLIENGADPNATSFNHRRSKAFGWLFGQGEWPALFFAIQAGNEKAVESLIAHGADVDFTGYWDRSLLHMAVLTRPEHPKASLAIIQKLIDAGADVNTAAPMMTPLHDAAQNGFIDVAELLLKNGADPRLKMEAIHRGCLDPDSDFGEMNAVQVAKAKGHTELVKLLNIWWIRVHLGRC